MMKKLVSLVLALTFIFTLTACSGKDMGRVKYNLDMEDFVELSKFEGIKIDTNSADYQKIYNDFLAADVQNYGLYGRVTEGTLKKGDVANISYVGKIDGVAFQGGSAEYFDLELGSNQFIAGFEDGLIGKEIGKTVDLNLTFPKDYGNTELAGKAVVFTVTINYVSIYDKTYEGTLKNGDTVNIDFTGKIDGKEFKNGSAKNYKLVLGSGSFIAGFESGLVGKKIGDTIDLNLTFPSTAAAEIAGKDVVFTVKINYTTALHELTPEEYFDDLGHKTVEEYYESVKRRTLENIIITKLIAECEIIEYPEEEVKLTNKQGRKYFENLLKQQYGESITLEYYLTASNMTDEDFEQEVRKNYSEPLMEEEMILYAIFDKAGLKIKKDELVKFTKKIVAEYKSDKITEKTLKAENGEDYFESLYIREKAFDYVIKKAKLS